MAALSKTTSLVLSIIPILICAAVGVMLWSSSLELYYDNEAMGKSFLLYAWPIGLALLTLPSMLLLSTLRRKR
jgi:hypothetical protein